ncbi:Shedu anti-phage system protein SduA domain-containing protein [Jeotgalibacillus proteolyticus]|uniref:Shedu anti-phage system protein SduA domain-containing protein n=1 Tax=Jeotgalibacillus proteolyticus TaxID=2082395 RepID=UPI001FD65C33|nr:Shedu anti-phage system protein SduA domain-containing protein [Jeotgalibacillus proteolyticus]
MTKEEILEWKRVKNSEKDGILFGRINKFREYPKAARHYSTLFPNNYLDIQELKNEEYISKVSQKFLEKINEQNVNERQILNFINNNQYYLIIASLFNLYDFGHHDAYLFKEFPLGNSYVVDYLLVGKGSGGYEFIFVELEKPSERIFVKSGDLGDTFTKGLRQIANWKRWCENHFLSLRETFDKCRSKSADLPSEFFSSDSTRRHYVVIAGRRKDFEKNSEITYTIRHEKRKNEAIQLLHYDNLYDLARRISGKDSY